MKVRYGILAGIVLVAALLRFSMLGRESLWYDEIVTLQVAGYSFKGIWAIYMGGEYNPPLYYWIAHLALPWFGRSEAGLRVVPALFGTLAVIPAYLLGKKIGGEWTGLGTAWMTAISAFALFYSQEARGYSLVMLLMALGLWAYFEALDTDADNYWAVAVVSFALAVWTNYYVLVFLAVLFVGQWVIMKKPSLKGFGEPGISPWWFVFFLVLPIIGTAALQFGVRATTNTPWGYHGLDVLTWGVTILSGSFWAIALIFLCLMVMSLVMKPDRRKWLLAAFVFVPMLIGIPVSEYISMIPRYFMPATIPLFVLVADAWEPFIKPRIPVGKFVRPFLVGVFVVLISLNLVMLPGYYGNLYKDDWRGVAADLGNQVRPGDTVVSVPGYRVDAEMWYYFPNQSLGVMVKPAYNVTEVKEACGAECWVITTPDTVGKFWEFQANGWVDEHGTLVERKGFISVYWYVSTF